MTYRELKRIFQELKRTAPKEDLTAHIIFTEDSFNKPYPLLSRAYCFSSDNKAFWPSMGGYSIFACCLDGTDRGVRLDWYMEEEGHPGGWKVENCYILERMQDAAVIPELVCAESASGVVYSFGTTFIRVRKIIRNEKIRLEPLSGNQITHGQWIDLPIDRVYGYCTLLERYLNRRGGH